MHFGAAGGEDIAIGGEPVSFLFGIFFVLLFVPVVEDLYLNTGGKTASALLEVFDRFRRGPYKNAGVTAKLEMTPLGDEFEIGHDVVGANNTNGMAGAMNHAVGSAPGGGGAIDVGKVGEFEVAPAEGSAVDERFGFFGDAKDKGSQSGCERNKTSEHEAMMFGSERKASLNLCNRPKEERVLA